MTTTTKKTTRTRKPVERHCRLSSPVNGRFALLLTVGKEQCGYYLTELPAADLGRVFHLAKFSTDIGTDTEARSYDVLISDDGRHECTCKGWCRFQHCKHTESLVALINAGKL
jgi:hypothetical protein